MKESAVAGLGFVFAGSGTQYPAMGATLYAASARFRTVFDRISARLNEWLQLPLQAVVFARMSSEALASHPFMSCSNFALQAALIEHLSDLGLRPAALLAHSLGGHAAAYCAGAVSLDEACELMRIRCSELAQLQRPGAMAVVEADVLAVQELLARRKGSVEIVSVNGPKWVTLAGEKELLEETVEDAVAAGFTAKMHAISHAFHSAFMDPLLDSYRARVRGFGARPVQVPMFSSAGGAVEVVDEDYWLRQLRAPMNFAHAYAAFRQLATGAIVEIGPADGFSRLVKQLDHTALVLPCLSRTDTAVFPDAQFAERAHSVFVEGA